MMICYFYNRRTLCLKIISLLLLTVISLALEPLQAQTEEQSIGNTEAGTIRERFTTPDGFFRNTPSANSFSYYLANLPLEEQGALVKYYNGMVKPNQSMVAAVIQMDIGNKNLQQCADAVMRLRAEYLYQQKEFDKIHFNFTNGFRVDYSKWIKGYRVNVKGNKCHWLPKANPGNSYSIFKQYMESIFMYAGTLSLEKELIEVNITDMQIGDIFIQGGSPGHAVVVVDMATNNTGQKVFMLAQSYMPAQSIHVLTNPNTKDSSPWYILNADRPIVTPEWTFNSGDLKRFP